MKKKFTVTKPEDVLTISGVILNSDTRMVASALNYNAQILKDALNRIAELEKKIKLQSKIGHWVYVYTFTDGVYYRCSECGFIDKLNTDKKLLYNRCPNCKAEMKSEVK